MGLGRLARLRGVWAQIARVLPAQRGCRRDRDRLLHHARARIGRHPIRPGSSTIPARRSPRSSRAAPRSSGPARSRTASGRFWIWLSASAFAWAAGQIVWSYYELIAHRPVAVPVGGRPRLPARGAVRGLRDRVAAPRADPAHGARPHRGRLVDRRDVVAVRRLVRAAREPLPLGERPAVRQPGDRARAIPSATSSSSRS